MDAAGQTQLSIAALACSLAALFFSLVAAFPGLKIVLAAVRDAVLWLALLFVLGAAGFTGWQFVEEAKRQQSPSDHHAAASESAPGAMTP